MNVNPFHEFGQFQSFLKYFFVRNISASWGILVALIQEIMERNGGDNGTAQGHTSPKTGLSKYYIGTNPF